MNPLAGTPTSGLVCRWRPATVSLLLATCGLGRVQAAGGMVACPVGDETVRAYLARPADTGPPSQGPGIVVVHHFWGLDSHTQKVADRFADLGYLTIAPDLYRGAIGGDPGLADDLMRKVDEGRAVAIVKAAIEYLRKLDPPAPRPVALVGFDMGGQLALATALQGANVQGVVIFYGHVATSPERLASLKAEVLAIFAGDVPQSPTGAALRNRVRVFRIHLPLPAHRPARFRHVEDPLRAGQAVRRAQVAETVYLVIPRRGPFPRGRHQSHPG